MYECMYYQNESANLVKYSSLYNDCAFMKFIIKMRTLTKHCCLDSK